MLRPLQGQRPQIVSSSKCLLLTGARQAGKSTIIKHVFPEYNVANFDDRLTRLQAKEEPKLFFLNNPRPLFIDEVQKENSILEEIKLIVDNSDARGNFILSGSAKLELMKGMSESLAGRVSVMELTGLSIREIKGIDFNRHFIPTEDYLGEREKHIKPYSDIWEIIHKGSYPELYDVESPFLWHAPAVMASMVPLPRSNTPYRALTPPSASNALKSTSWSCGKSISALICL